MGVKRLMFWAGHDGLSSWKNVVTGLQQALDNLNRGKQPLTKWQTKASLLRHVSKDGFGGHGKDMFVLQTCNDPSKRYFLLRHEKIVLEADLEMFAVISKTKLYSHKLSVNFEGSVYHMGDFSVRLAQAIFHSGKFAGVVLEVEYHPLDDVCSTNAIFADFENILQNATKDLPGKFTTVDVNFANFNLSSTYSMQHCTLQYLELVHLMLQVLYVKPKHVPVSTPPRAI